MQNLSISDFLSSVGRASRVQVIVDRGWIIEAVEATWFTDAVEEGEPEVYIDSDVDSSAARVTAEDLPGMLLLDSGRVRLRDGRVVVFFQEEPVVAPI